LYGVVERAGVGRHCSGMEGTMIHLPTKFAKHRSAMGGGAAVERRTYPAMGRCG